MSINWNKPLRIIDLPDEKVIYIQQLDNLAEPVHLIKVNNQTIAVYDDGVLPGEDKPWLENISEWRIVATSKGSFSSKEDAENVVAGFLNKSRWDIECVET